MGKDYLQKNVVTGGEGMGSNRKSRFRLDITEKILYPECDKALAQAPQRSCGCPIRLDGALINLV